MNEFIKTFFNTSPQLEADVAHDPVGYEPSYESKMQFLLHHLLVGELRAYYLANKLNLNPRIDPRSTTFDSFALDRHLRRRYRVDIGGKNTPTPLEEARIRKALDLISQKLRSARALHTELRISHQLREQVAAKKPK